MALVKALTPTQPSGISFFNEVEFYYPLQTSIAEWFPKEPVEPEEPEEPEEPMQPMQPMQPTDYDDNSLRVSKIRDVARPEISLL